MTTPRLIELQNVDQPTGALAIANLGAELPFAPGRFLIGFDVPPREIRGKHAHRTEEQLFIAVCGKLTIRTIDRAGRCKIWELDRPTLALYVPPLVWAEQEYTHLARMLLLVSATYSEGDYIRTWAEWVALAPALAA